MNNNIKRIIKYALAITIGIFFIKVIIKDGLDSDKPITEDPRLELGYREVRYHDSTFVISEKIDTVLPDKENN
jgi:hypothetical protein